MNTINFKKKKCTIFPLCYAQFIPAISVDDEDHRDRISSVIANNVTNFAVENA